MVYIEQEFHALFVKPFFQVKNVGSILLEKLLENVSGLVRVYSSLNAVLFYERNGFVKVSKETLILCGVTVPVVVLEM